MTPYLRLDLLLLRRAHALIVLTLLVACLLALLGWWRMPVLVDRLVVMYSGLAFGWWLRGKVRYR